MKNALGITFTTLTFACLLMACTNEAQLIADGNQAFTTGDYAAAARSYGEARQQAPDLAEPIYNTANTYYRQEGYEEAGQLMQQALDQVDDGDLAPSSYYNLGNIHFNNQDFAAAVEAYKEALRLNPDDTDAKHNLELALQYLAQQEQSEQPQPEPEEQAEDASPSPDESGQGEEGDQEENQQGQGAEEPDPTGDSDPAAEPEESESETEKAEDTQAEDENAENQQNTQASSAAAGNAADTQTTTANNPQPVEPLTEEQAYQLLEAIAQETKTLSEQLQQIYQVIQPPSSHDW